MALIEGLQGPLTTIFTPSASCLPFNDPSTITSVNYTFYHPYHIHTECQPSKTTGGYFSPAICPSGYNGAVASAHDSLISKLDAVIRSDVESGLSFSTILAPEESVDFCCPAGYEAAALDWCTSNMDRNTILTIGLSPDTTVTSLVTGVASADVIQIRFQRTDRLPLPTSYSRSSAESTITPTQTVSPTTPPPQTPLTTSNRIHSWSTIVVAVSVTCALLAFVCAIIIITWMVIRHRKKAKRARDQLHDAPPPYSEHVKMNEIRVDASRVETGGRSRG